MLAYANFFTHHFVPDFRWVLIALSVAMFWKCELSFRTGARYRQMPLLIGLGMVALAIWGAENIGTYVMIISPSQKGLSYNICWSRGGTICPSVPTAQAWWNMKPIWEAKS